MISNTQCLVFGVIAVVLLCLSYVPRPEVWMRDFVNGELFAFRGAIGTLAFVLLGMWLAT